MDASVWVLWYAGWLEGWLTCNSCHKAFFPMFVSCVLLQKLSCIIETTAAAGIIMHYLHKYFMLIFLIEKIQCKLQQSFCKFMQIQRDIYLITIHQNFTKPKSPKFHQFLDICNLKISTQDTFFNDYPICGSNSFNGPSLRFSEAERISRMFKYIYIIYIYIYIYSQVYIS